MVSLPITAALISTTMIATSAYGGERYEAGQYYSSGGSYRAYARVADVVPIVRRRLTATPAQTCRWVRSSYATDARRYDDDGHYTHEPHAVVPTIVGGLIGSLIGHQFGSGHGKQALTIAGAVTGASIGNQIGRDRNRWHRDRLSRGPLVQRCHTVSHNRVTEDVDGYRVTYRYNGETFTKIMDAHPGNRVPISVSVIPFDE